MKRLLQNAARSVGFDVLSLAYSKDYIYDHHLVEMLHRHKIETVLDIGANIGGYGALLRKLGFTGTIHSFEPVAAPLEKLRALAASDPKWHVHNVAFGETSGTATINVMAGSELCSFLKPAETSTRMTVTASQEVTVTTLDEFDADWSKTFVKIDTQGHDLAVMCGGREALKKAPLMQTEVSMRPIYQDMPSFADSIAYLNSIGFDVTGLFPVSRDDHMRIVEFDCMAVNRAVLAP